MIDAHRRLVTVEVVTIIVIIVAVVVRLAIVISPSAIQVMLLAPLGAVVTIIVVLIVAVALLLVVIIVVRLVLLIAIFIFVLLLLHEYAIQLDVAVVHDQIFGHESFQIIAIDDIKGTVLSQATHEVLHAALVGFPLLNVALDLHLGVR